MAGEIDISKLSGAQRAMALAADLDKSGKIDNAFEKSIYNDMVGDAGYDANMGLQVEQLSLDEQIKAGKKEAKEADKSYGKIFGSLAGEIKAADDKANDRVADIIKQYGESEKLNEAIATRPNPMKYVGKGAEYLQELTEWATRVRTAGEESIKEHIDAGNEKLSKQMTTEHAKQNEQMTKRFDSLDEQLKGIANTVYADLMVDLEDLKIDTKSLNLEQRIFKATQQISKDIKDIKAVQQQIRSIVIQDLMIDRADLAVDLENLAATNYYGEANLMTTRYYGEANLSETRYQGETTRETVDAKGNQIIANTDEKAKQTQELDAAGNTIQNQLNSRSFFSDDVPKAAGELEIKIRSSNLPHDKKMELYKKYSEFIDKEGYLSMADVKTFEKEVDKAIYNYGM